MKNRMKLLVVAAIISISCKLMGTETYEQVIRPIELSGDNKYKAIFLDDEIYHYAQQDLEDLRIIDQKGQEVPYYLYSGELLKYHAKVQYVGEIVDEFIKDDKSYMDIKVEQEENKDRLLSYLVLEIEDDNFTSSVTVLGSYDGLNWEMQNGGSAEKIYKVANGQQMKVHFNEPVKYSYFRLVRPRELQKISFSGVWGGYEEETEEESLYKLTKDGSYDIKQDAEEKTTTVILDNKDYLKIVEIGLSVKGNFNRGYQLIGVSENQEENVVQTGRLYNDDVNKEAEEIKIILEDGGRYHQFKLEIMNGDDLPLEIEKMTEVYTIDKMVFKAEAGETYEMVYGGGPCEAPNYDIVYYKEQIEDQPQDVITLGEKKITTKEEKAEVDYMWIYKILIGVTSLVLIATIISAGSGKKKYH